MCAGDRHDIRQIRPWFMRTLKTTCRRRNAQYTPPTPTRLNCRELHRVGVIGVNRIRTTTADGFGRQFVIVGQLIGVLLRPRVHASAAPRRPCSVQQTASRPRDREYRYYSIGIVSYRRFNIGFSIYRIISVTNEI